MTDIIASLQGTSWFTIITAVVTLASAIAAVTPTPTPGSVWAKVYSCIDFLALNILKAKDTGVTPPVVK